MEEKEKTNGEQPVEETTRPLTKLEQYEKDRRELKAEKKEYRERRKNKRGRKTLRGRKLKNFNWFLLGFVSFLLILILGIFIGAKLLPMNTYLKGDKIVKEDTIGKNSIVDAVMNIGKYGMSDVPVAYNLANGLITNGLGGVVSVDSEGLKALKFDNTFGDSLMGITRISKDAFGGLSKLELFENTPVPAGEETKSGVNLKLFYFFNNEKLEKAFTDEGTMKEEAIGCTLYYPALNEISIKEMKDIIGDRFKLLKVQSVLKAFGGTSDDSDIAKIIGDRTIGEMGEFNADNVLLKNVLKAEETNKLWLILCDATGKDSATMTLGDLKSFDADKVKLKTVITGDVSDNAILKTLLSDKYNPDDNPVTLGNISSKINDVKLSDMYEIECFTEEISLAKDSAIKYAKTANGYEYSATGSYYISKDAKVWMYLFYTAGVNTKTVGDKLIIEEYTDNGLTFSNLSNSVGSVASKVMQSTVYQLYMVGILDSNYEKIQNQTLTTVMETLNDML